jgi:hypothetical protein
MQTPTCSLEQNRRKRECGFALSLYFTVRSSNRALTMGGGYSDLVCVPQSVNQKVAMMKK